MTDQTISLSQQDITIVPQSNIPLTQTSTSDIQNTKDQIEAEYAAKPHGGSKTPWIIIGLAVALLIIFGIIVLVFFLVFNPPATHEIAVFNNCSENINVLFGVVTPNQTIEFFPTVKLSPRQTIYYAATPGTSIIMQGYRDGDVVLSNAINPFTTAELTLAGEGFGGKHEVRYGNNIITNVHITNDPVDRYGVSLQGGYNIPISVDAATSGTNLPSGNFTCTAGPTWNHTINATGSNKCPDELQSPGTGSNYQVCLNPCTTIGGTGYCCTEGNACSATGGCESLWPRQDYYTVFEMACPNCLITNCDTPQYTCNSTKGLTSYLITFCP